MTVLTRMRNGEHFQRTRARTRQAFTLVELLVVIAIIGILVALLLPAVQSAREAARRVQCTNQLKQLGLAVLSYESAHQEFPPGSYTYGPWGSANTDKVPFLCPDYDCNGTNWAIEILPFLEQQAIYDQYDHDEHNFEANDLDGDGLINQRVRDADLPIMICPSDSFAQNWGYFPTAGSYKAMTGVITQYGNSNQWLNWTSPVGFAGGGSNPTVDVFKKNFYNRGLFHLAGPSGMRPERFKNVIDGSSNTVMIGEFHWLPDQPGNPEPVKWAVSQRWSNKAEALADPLLRSTNFGNCEAKMQTAPKWSCWRAFGSTHSGDGGNWVNIDGSVSFITWSLDGRIYEAMATIAGQDGLQTP